MMTPCRLGSGEGVQATLSPRAILAHVRLYIWAISDITKEHFNRELEGLYGPFHLVAGICQLLSQR